MGYQSDYQLEVIEQKTVEPTDIIANLLIQSEYAAYALDGNGDTNESCKWYECEEQIKAFSKGYPNHLFIITKQGEDGRQWKFYIMNGKSQVAEMVPQFEAFDPSKLK